MGTRLDNLISDVSYLFWALKAYRDIVESGNCNECARINCEYVPAGGELVRFNCPFFQRDKEEETET